MLEVLAIAILGAATLGSQKPQPELDSEAMARVLLGLDYVVRFTYTDHGLLFKSIRAHGDTIRLWNLPINEGWDIMHLASEKAGWYSAEGETDFPDGSMLDDGNKVTVKVVGRVKVWPDEMNDIYTYDLVMTVPQEARFTPA